MAGVKAKMTTGDRVKDFVPIVMRESEYTYRNEDYDGTHSDEKSDEESEDRECQKCWESMTINNIWCSRCIQKEIDALLAATKNQRPEAPESKHDVIPMRRIEDYRYEDPKEEEDDEDSDDNEKE